MKAVATNKQKKIHKRNEKLSKQNLEVKLKNPKERINRFFLGYYTWMSS
jgi:hypothetical protein